MDGLPGILVALGALFLAGLVTDVVARRVGLPRVTLLLVVGFVAGPSVLDLLPDPQRTGFHVVATLALVMVGFLLGEHLTLRRLRRRGAIVLATSIAVAAATAGVVAAGLFLLGVPVVLALLLGGVATATDPAATADVVRESGSEGPFTDTLLQIVAIDDAWGLLTFGFVVAAAGAVAGGGFGSETVLHALREIGGAILLGAALGAPMAAITGRIEPGEPTQAEALGFVLLCGGLALHLEVSFLLAAMTLGAAVANLARHHTRPFHAIEGIEWPFLIVFFVLAGAALDLNALAGVGTWLAAFVALRVAGRVLGALVGAGLSRAEASVRRWMGTALLPQAGVALGMALVARERFPEHGEALLSITVAATVLFEAAGPLATRLALTRAGEVGHAPADGGDPAEP